MNIIPLSDKANRVQWEIGMKEEREFVLVNKFPVPPLKVTEASHQKKLVRYAGKMLTVFNK